MLVNLLGITYCHRGRTKHLLGHIEARNTVFGLVRLDDIQANKLVANGKDGIAMSSDESSFRIGLKLASSCRP